MPPCPTVVRTTAAACAVALGALTAFAAPDVAAGATHGTTPSAQAKYQAAMNALGHKGVHFDSTASQNGVTIKVVGDTGSTSGIQKLVVHNTSGTERMTALVVGPTGYIKANAPALEHVIGLAKTKATKYSGKWLSFPTANSRGLNQLVTGLLNSEVAAELKMSGPYHYGSTTTVEGHRALVIHGFESTQNGTKIATVLYVPTTGTPLPIKEVTNPGSKGGKSAIHGTVTFTHWGQNKTQKKPTHSVSVLKLVPAASGSTTTTTPKG